MLTRIFVSLLLIPLVVAAIEISYLNYLPVFVLFFLVSILSTMEINRIIRRMLNEQYFKVYQCISYFFNGMLFVLYYFFGSFSVLLLSLIVVIFIVISTFLKRVILRESLLFFLTFAYTGLIPLTIPVIRTYSHGNILLYYLLLLVWINDASALFIGKKFGKIKGIVKYSPNKSLEGYIGSFIVSTLFSLIFKLIFYEKICFSIGFTVLISITISITGHLGDIFESYLKRKAGMKDSSSILPGLGGVLDVFDSVYASLPLFYFFIILVC